MADQITKTFSITGSSFLPGAWALVEQLRGGQAVALKREPGNKYDRNAIMVGVNKRHVGYIPRGLASEIAPVMDAGIRVICRKARNSLPGVCELAYIPPDLEHPHDPVPN